MKKVPKRRSNEDDDITDTSDEQNWQWLIGTGLKTPENNDDSDYEFVDV